MEMEDKLRVLGDSSTQQTHLCESGDAIEFSNICLCSTTDTTSTDPINHRNGLLRTHNSARRDVSGYSYNSLLSSGHFIFKRSPRNSNVQTLYWQNSCFQRLTADLWRTFHSCSMLKIEQNFQVIWRRVHRDKFPPQGHSHVSFKFS